MKEWHGDDIAEEDISEHVVVEDGDEVAAAAAAKVAKLKEEIESLRKEKQEYMDGWQRAKADYVNLLKRIESDTKAAEGRGKVKAIESLLPALDALERAGAHGELPSGFDAIVKQLESAFAGLGLTALGEVGETFDPSLHEALGQDVVATLENDDTVTVVLEKGWKLSSAELGTGGEVVIRPAKVRVAHFNSSNQ
ncbi:MAG: nucleotide exchange factor GrpE [Patescibacteria group bacterium]